jgi:hypothetical protein
MFPPDDWKERQKRPCCGTGYPIKAFFAKPGFYRGAGQQHIVVALAFTSIYGYI